ACPQDHPSDWGFAPFRAWHSDHAAIGHGLMPAQNSFEINRIDVEPARDDHVFLPIKQDQEPVRVEIAHIARTDEVLSLGAGPKRGARLIWGAFVAAHHRGRASGDLAN